MRILVIGLLVGGASTTIAAPQQTTLRPGEMTQARVWVENRDSRESIPVSIQDVSRDLTPVRVRVVNAQTWEYTTIRVPANGLPPPRLNDLGVMGWELAGVSIPQGDGTLLLLKRPRP